MQKPSRQMLASGVLAIPVIFRVIAAFIKDNDIVNAMTDPLVVICFFIFGGFLLIFKFIVRPVLFSFLLFFVIVASLAITYAVYAI